MNSGACFDSTGTYRYSLWRSWNENGSRLAFIMLNPSTADDQINDATIRRCISFAESWGYGSLEVVNLFALRTPYPQRLREVPDPVGDECDFHILAAVERAKQTIVAWGNWGSLHQRDRAVLELLSHLKVHCLGWNQSGQPRHPLYLKRDVRPVPYEWSDSTQSRISAFT
jgi:hypothetical protein